MARHCLYILTMQFEWDEAKAQANLDKHGLDFEDAKTVFSRPVVITPDARRDYGELRYKALGELDGVIVYIAFTPRGDAVRIISMRPANRKEREAYAEVHQKRP